LLQLLVHFCRRHPSAYRRIRQEVVELQVRSPLPEVRRLATDARATLRTDLRRYLGDNKPVAMDVDTGREYRWPDVIGLEDDIDPADQERLHHAVEHTAVVREAVFLFSGGRMIDLHDIPLGGIWVSLLGIGHGKRVYRVSVQTRHMGAYDVALNLTESLGAEQIQDEVDSLVLAGWGRGGARLVEDFGGWWPELNLWSEEYVSGETVARYLERCARREDPQSREALEGQWPLFIWSAAETYMALLQRTGFALQLPDPDPRDIVVPPHDYQLGTRLVSVASRRPFSSLAEYLQRFHERFVAATEARHPFLRRADAWDFVFAGIVEAAGEQEGRALLEQARREMTPVPERLDAFLTHIADHGFMSRRLYFAVRRFRRWLDLARDPDLAAQARTLAELSDTYGLKAVEAAHPGTRTRFFLETVFRDSDPDLIGALRRVARRQRTDGISIEEAVAMFSAIQDTHPISDREAFFLARIGYPHLRPTDQATLQDMAVDGSTGADLVVQLEDRFGDPFWVRAPSSPREISRLHHLFAVEKLRVDFRPEHRFLVAISERGHLIGGLFFQHVGEQTAHMDKLVVSHHFRRRGISQGLMGELFDRLRDQGIRHLTTGFFRPAYFYRLGFRVARHVAGLVRDLGEE
ncbi:MAG: GNAT family N-acetyltransferase, partial [Deltaproteobacteria bacterium]|nr:GNAT family N-acetyltransferase [Deltaproteobacteria bacterium]